jgi:hypothetical protein
MLRLSLYKLNLRHHKEIAMAHDLIISSDSHVFEPPDLWTERIDP